MRDKKEEDVAIVTPEEDFRKAEKKLKKLKKSLKDCEKERKEYLNGWQREKADAQNQRKNHLSRIAEEQSRALARYVEAVLPVLDSVRAARSHVGENDAPASGGLEQVYSQCLQSFVSLGVTIIDPVGEQFNPNEHEAIGKKEVAEEGETDMIVEVVRVGAKVDAVLIRAAMGYVGEYKNK